MEKYRKLKPQETRDAYKKLMKKCDRLVHVNSLFTYTEVACSGIDQLLSVCYNRAILYFNSFHVEEPFQSFVKRMKEEILGLKVSEC